MLHKLHLKLSIDKVNRGRNASVSFLFILAMLSISSILVFQSSPAAVTAVAPRHFTPRTQSVPMTQSIFLRRGYYDYYEVDSSSSNASVAYSVLSSAPISTALMTSAQLNEFANSQSDPVSNSITYANGTSVQNNVTISPGQYFLVFYAFYSRANIEFGYQVSPNTPFSYGPISTQLASGIATFGIANNSGVATPYEIRTNEIVGAANISSFQVNTPNADQYGVSVTGATLQLNALLLVNDKNGSGQSVYWVQNVPDFETGVPQVSFGDEIWNFTDESGVLSNQSVTSTNLQNGGFVSPTGQGNNGGPYVYNYNGPNDTYSLPLNFVLIDKATVLPKSGILVQLGYALSENGTNAVARKIVWFDNVTIVDPNVQSSYFDVSGLSTTPIGLFYDAELVFAGEGNLEVAHFTQLSASLGLFYQSSSAPNGVLSSFPTYYGFSGDTGEGADDLVVNYSNGIASVGAGTNPSYSYLGNSTLTTSLQNLMSATSQTSTTTSTHTVSTTVSQTSATTSSSTATASTSSIPLTITSTTSLGSTTSTATTSSMISTQGSNLSPGNGSDSGSSSTLNSASSTSTGVISLTSNTTTSGAMSSSSTVQTAVGGTQQSLELIALGVVVGVVLASLAFLAIRRRTPSSTASPPLPSS